MSTEHTPGKLTVRGGFILCAGATTLAGTNSVPDARRLVACWNFCDEVSTKNLEDNMPLKELLRRYNAAMQQNSDLLEALDEAATALGAMGAQCGEADAARAAIAKAKGGA